MDDEVLAGEEPISVRVPADWHGARLDATAASLFPQFSRSRLAEWIKAGRLLRNQLRGKPRDKVVVDDELYLNPESEDRVEWSPEDLPLDVCYVLRDGSDITLVTWGAMIKETLEAADQLAERGISAEVIDVATISPLDMETIIESVQKTGRCVIVHEAARHCGVGAEIAAGLADAGIWHLHAPVKRVTGYDSVMPLYKMEMKYMPSVKRILNAVNEILEVS